MSEIKAAAQAAWEKMNASERHGVRYGLFPAWVAETYSEVHALRDGHRLFAVALMEIAGQS